MEKFGLVMFAQAFMSFFAILTDYGFNLSATREISINRYDKEKITEIFSAVMIAKLVLIIISLLLLSVIVFSFDKFNSNYDIYYISFLVVISQAFFPIWYFQGMERMKYITIVNIVSKFAFFIAIFLFIRNEDDYILVPLFNGVGGMVGTVYSLYILKSKFSQGFSFQSLSIVAKYFKDSSQFFLSRISVSIYTSANSFVLGLFTNNIIVGYYALAERLYQAIQSLYGPLVQALYPYMSKEKNIKLFKRIFYFTILINLVISFTMYLFGREAFDFLFTEKLGKDSLIVFHILLIANVIAVPSILIGYPFLGALGYTSYTNKSVMYASFLHFLGFFLLVISEHLNLYNVTFLVCLTELFVLFIRVYKIKIEGLWL